MKILVYVLAFGAGLMVFHFMVTLFLSRWAKWQETHMSKMSEKLDESFIFLEKKKLILVSSAPLFLGVTGFIVLGNIVGGVMGFVVGLAIPAMFVRAARQRRIKQFQGQLVDCLMIFSSSLKGGLSFIQAMEIVCEEMPPPASQEFGLVLKENRLGVSLEDSLEGLRERMPLEELNLMISSILVARETGGELTRVFSRLVGTIRDNLKLKAKITTLTLQGRLQGIIMAFLPVAFALFIYRQNPHHFDIMLETDLGRQLLIAAVILQIVGMILIKRISTLRA